MQHQKLPCDKQEGKDNSLAGIRVCAGYYRRYNDKVVYVVSLATDPNNGREVVIWTTYPFTDVPRYYTSSKKSFCVLVEVSGERRTKYKWLINMEISGVTIERLEDEDFRGPVRKIRPRRMGEEYDTRTYQQATTYHTYTRELCENYSFDLRKYHFCVSQRQHAAVTESDFGKLKEDLYFLDNTLRTVLADYRDYFRKRFVDGLSIRKYAETYQLNRGSVDYLQERFLSAFV